VLANLGVAYLRKNNPTQAQMYFRQALDLNPNNRLARSFIAGTTTSAVPGQETTQPVTTGSPQPPAPAEYVDSDVGQGSQPDNAGNTGVDDLLAQAKAQRDSNPGESERLFREVLSRDPNNFEAMVQVGRFLTLKKDYPAAIQYYQNALQINTQSPEAYFNLGYIYLSQGAYDTAKKNYESCLSLSPSFKDEVITNLGIIELKKKNTARARQLFRDALDLNPNNNIAKNYLNSLGKAP